MDDGVLMILGDDADVYAPALVEVAKYVAARNRSPLGFIGILESKPSLRRQIERLLVFQAPRTVGVTAASILGIGLFAAVAMLSP